MKTLPVCFGTALALVLGCAHLERTDRLDEARAEYEKASRGPAAQYSPAELATAKKALDQADASLKTGDAKLVDAQASLALLKIQHAESLGRGGKAAAERDAALRELNLTREQMLEQTQQRLSETEQQLEHERQARNEAESNLAQSRQELEQYAQVRDVARGTVITLSGGVLFDSGKSELLPGAQDRLGRVATFLKSSPRAVVVEGYTDSQGSPALNDSLSRRRAEVVRDYLVSQGVPAGRIRANGKGPSAPVASNATSSGRALNRRVEIVLERPPAGEQSQGVGGSSTGQTGDR